MRAKTEINTAASKRGSSNGSDAIALLKADHTTVRKLFEAYEEAKEKDDGDKKSELGTQICQQLTIHATIEEELFYPAVREEFGGDEKDVEMLDEAEVEHSRVKVLVAEIQEAIESNSLDGKADAKVKVLSECVEHHVREEEDKMFPEVKKSEFDLDAIGAQLTNRKEELQADLA